MRRVLPATVAMIALAAMLGSANAADLSRRAPPVKAPAYIPPPVFSWTGFYIGVHGAGAAASWTDTATTAALVPAGVTTDNNASGVLGGVQAGFNYQFSNIVAGVEVEYAVADVRNTTALPFPAIGVTASNDLTGLGTVTGRLGWATGRMLLYAKGGLAWGQGHTSVTVPAVVSFSDSYSRTGWTAGAGIEYAFWNNWSAKLEYDYIDLGTSSQSLASSGVPLTVPFDSSLTMHEVKVGLNYRF